jgi:hypothetical protein
VYFSIVSSDLRVFHVSSCLPNAADIFRFRTTLVAVILNHIGLYCEQSWSPAWGHVYVRDGPFFRWQFYQSIIWQISSIISLSVTIAMYCLFQLYLCVAKELDPHRPVLKLFSVKSVGAFDSLLQRRLD